MSEKPFFDPAMLAPVRKRIVLFSAAAILLLALALAFKAVSIAAGGILFSIQPDFFCRVRWSSVASVGLGMFLLGWGIPWLARRAQVVPALLPIVVLLAGLALALRSYLSAPLVLGPILAAAGLCLWLFRTPLARCAERLVSAGKIPRRAALVVALSGFALYFGLNQGMHGGQPFISDSQARLFHAHILNDGRWFLPAPESPELYVTVGTVMHEGRWYSQYLPGAILLNLLGLRIGSVSFVFCFLAMGCILLTWELGRRLWNEATGILGAIFLLLSPMFALLSSSFMEHTPTTFFLLAALVAGLRAADTKSRRLWFLGGFLLGYAVILRPLSALGVALAILAAGAVWSPRNQRPNWWSLLAAALGAALPLAFLLLFNLKTTGHPFLLAYRIANPARHSLGFTALNGHTPMIGLLNQLDNVTSLSEWLFMWPMTSYILLFCFYWVRGFARRDALLTLPLAGLLFAYFFYPAEEFFFTPRFVAESLPFLALLTARGLLELATFMRTALGPKRSRPIEQSLFALLVGLSLSAVFASQSRFAYFDALSKRGQHLAEALRPFVEDPSATVFLDADISEHYLPRVVPLNALSFGGAQFLIGSDPAAVAAYRAAHPERHFFLVKNTDLVIPIQN